MKKCLATLVLVMTTVLTVSTVRADVKKFPTPEYHSSSIVDDKIGMTENYSFKFDEVEIDTVLSDLLLLVNGEFVPYTGVLKDGKTFVPLRVVSQAFGMQVGWDRNTQQVTVDNIVLTIGSKYATVNGKQVTLTELPYVENGVTYIPLRFIATSLEKQVGFVSAKDKNMQLENSFVWIDDEEMMDNAGYSTKEMKIWLQSRLLENPELFEYVGNEEPFLKEDVESMEYVNQIGRYAIFSTNYPVFVDMKNQTAYLNGSWHGHGVIYKISFKVE